MNQEKKKCFVIMPISESGEYSKGHFLRVYEHIIKPACQRVGLDCIRADDVKSTNHIVIDILQRILASDLVVCDLSAKNANVMYELGIRQAFDRPVVLLKDKQTDRVFDIQGLRTIDYDESLRVDTVSADINSLVLAMEATINANENDVNSLVRLLSVPKASISDRKEISPDTALILNSLREMSQRISGLESRGAESSGAVRLKRVIRNKRSQESILINNQKASLGDELYWDQGGTISDAGRLVAIDEDGIALQGEDGLDVVGFNDARFERLSVIPF